MPSSRDPALTCAEMLTVLVFILLSVAGALAALPPGRTDAYGNIRMSAWNAAQNPMAGSPVPYYNPVDNGGTMFDNTGNGLGEPLNVSIEHALCAGRQRVSCFPQVIISGLSSPEVIGSGLEGILNYARAIGL